jgi:hypothetical protein
MSLSEILAANDSLSRKSKGEHQLVLLIETQCGRLHKKRGPISSLSFVEILWR